MKRGTDTERGTEGKRDAKTGGHSGPWTVDALGQESGGTAAAAREDDVGTWGQSQSTRAHAGEPSTLGAWS
eukprot:3378105-Rhodomonas_salina.1